MVPSALEGLTAESQCISQQTTKDLTCFRNQNPEGTFYGPLACKSQLCAARDLNQHRKK
jgi:hypothetical protein